MFIILLAKSLDLIIKKKIKITEVIIETVSGVMIVFLHKC